ncbi:TPR-like protein, partial [Auriscalpium vulgare]
AAQLKERGNALFAKKDYRAAVAKYTAAIALDSQNAVLYANRAACYLGLKSYELSAADAMKATELDPGYSKAWARLSSAQE